MVVGHLVRVDCVMLQDLGCANGKCPERDGGIDHAPQHAVGVGVDGRAGKDRPAGTHDARRHRQRSARRRVMRGQQDGAVPSDGGQQRVVVVGIGPAEKLDVHGDQSRPVRFDAVQQSRVQDSPNGEALVDRPEAPLIDGDDHDLGPRRLCSPEPEPGIDRLALEPVQGSRRVDNQAEQHGGHRHRQQQRVPKRQPTAVPPSTAGHEDPVFFETRTKLPDTSRFRPSPSAWV